MSVIAIGGDREHRDPPVEHVVLVDGRGRPIGTSPKRTVHHAETPLHLAFSCHVVRADGAVLLTRRALTKPTWPGAWTNACCGHPQLGESLRDATVRRLQQELGVAPVRLALAIPDFVYRAEMSDGVVEHELCPVLVGRIDGDPQPNDAEVADFRWVPWPELIRQVTEHPTSLSPWSVEQFTELIDRGWAPEPWLAAGDEDPLSDTLIRPNTVPTSRRPPPLSTSALDVVDRQVVPRLDRILADKSDAVRRIDPHVGDLVGEIITLVQAGGKRLRPAFVYWGHRATGAGHDDRVIDLAVAMELLHTFALLHDDVMDRSEHRRGSATAHRSFAAGHRAADRLGDSEWFGTSAAVLAGDLTFVLADEVLGAAALDAAAHARCRAVFDELRTEVIAGQFLDLVLAAEPCATESWAAKVALLKSARYTVTRPLALGAAAADPAATNPCLGPALHVYGDAIGMAFQMRDDVLGLFGDPVTTGKSDADDVREGKRTMLVVRAMRVATPAQRAVLETSLGDADLDDAGIDRVRDVVAATGALASIEALIDAQHLVAVNALRGLPEPANSALVELAALAIDRPQ